MIGQDNILRYRPHKKICFRIQDQDPILDILRVLAAAMSCSVPLHISWNKNHAHIKVRDHLAQFCSCFHLLEENDALFNERIQQGQFRRVRMISKPSDSLKFAASQSGTFLDHAPVLSNGRFELLHYLREISFSIDYHRYGNLGMREAEHRKALS